MTEKQKIRWKFHRLGGVDQVVLRTPEEICSLRELDPKLWVALACPTFGLELDNRLLELIDSDSDGRVRVPEVIAATEWICARLKDPGAIIDPAEALPISEIDDSTEEGRKLITTAKAILESRGKGDATSVGIEEVSTAIDGAAEHEFNGDGILPPKPKFDPDIRKFIQAALDTVGGLRDGSGEAGINIEIANVFVQSLKAWIEWKDSISHAGTPLGDDTPEGWNLMQELKPKFDDYFLRCELASYAPQSTETLNPAQEMFVQQDNAVFIINDLKDLPLSRVAANRPLDVREGLNPAWREQVQRFLELCSRYLDNQNQLTREHWLEIQKAFEPYASAFAAKPGTALLEVEFEPDSSFDRLGADLIKSVIESDVLERFMVLAEKDATYPAPAADITDLKRLVLYYRSLHRLLRNFVSFYDFYALKHNAAFQAGTLYIDGRSCLLCVPVKDADEHSVLAGYSELFLLYLKCSRKAAAGSKEPGGERLIAAAITAGNSDLLLQGRNGVFIDNEGYDWDAQVIKVVSKPISLWEAIWEPYKKVARMINEQISKFAASRQQGVLDSAGNQVATSAAAVTAPAATPAGAPKFDIARSAGIFAAIGLALGAIGTALASLASAAFALEWWQFPLVFLAIFLIISGPSVIIAWLKLRGRTLGPLLEASGWAVNNRAPINISLAGELTFTAKLPANAHRMRKDPLKRRGFPIWVLVLAFLLSAGIGCWWLINNSGEPENAAFVNAGNATTGQVKATQPASAPVVPANSTGDSAE